MTSAEAISFGSSWFSACIETTSILEKNAVAAAASFLRIIDRVLGLYILDRFSKAAD
jgi:hypothetical protein